MESKASTRRQQIGQIEPDQVPPLGSQKLAYTVPEFCAATGIGRTSVPRLTDDSRRAANQSLCGA